MFNIEQKNLKKLSYNELKVYLVANVSFNAAYNNTLSIKKMDMKKNVTHNIFKYKE